MLGHSGTHGGREASCGPRRPSTAVAPSDHPTCSATAVPTAAAKRAVGRVAPAQPLRTWLLADDQPRKVSAQGNKESAGNADCGHQRLHADLSAIETGHTE